MVCHFYPAHSWDQTDHAIGIRVSHRGRKFLHSVGFELIRILEEFKERRKIVVSLSNLFAPAHYRSIRVIDRKIG